MKKLLTLFTVLTILGSMMTVKADYCVAHNAVMNANSWNASADVMTQVGSTDIYTITFNNVSTNLVEFKVTDGTWDNSWGWDNAKQNLSNISLSGNGGNISFTPSSSTNITIYYNSANNNVYVIDANVSYVTLSAGTTIYYDLTSYSGSGINIYAPGAPTDWYASTASLISFALTDDWVISSDITLFRSGPNNQWDNRKCATLPTTGQNMIVSTDGINCHWDTYSGGAPDPTPETIQLHSNITNPSWETSAAFHIASNEETASLTLNDVAVGNYQFGLHINGAWITNGSAYTRANTSHAIASGSGNCTFVADIAGNYTFTWTYATNTLSVTYPNMTTAVVKFFAPRTENNPWDNVFAFVWNGDVVYSESWPGDEITSTKNSGWYTYDVPVGASIIFSDNNTVKGTMQTADITDITADVCYVPTSIDNNVSPKVVSVATDGDCKVEYYIAGTKELLGGADDFDVHTQLDANNQIVFQNVAAGDYAFKISTGSSWVWGLGGNDHLMSECASIAKTVGVGNVGFTIDHTQDITITYYPATQKICLGAETTKSTASISVDDMSVYVGKSRTINVTYTSDATPQYEIVSGSEYISISGGKITGVAAGTATVRASVAETENYLGATDEFTVTVEALATAKVKFFAPKNVTHPWSAVYAFAWIGDDAQSAAWPGDVITASKEDEWYVYNVPLGASVLFHDNAGMQTTDINNVTAAACYVSTGLDDTDYQLDNSNPIYVTLTAQCAVDYYIAGSAALIGGTEDFDTNLSLGSNNQIIFHEVQPGTYAFKINNGSWTWSVGGNDHLKSGDCSSIAETVGLGDVGFTIATKQDVTITYYPATEEICLGAVTVKAATTVSVSDLAMKAGESKAIEFTTNNPEDPNKTYTVTSGAEYIGLFQGVLTGIKPGTATIRVALSETANYEAGSAEFNVTISNPTAPATAIAEIGGEFMINAKGDKAVFSRGNLRYNVTSQEWYCAEKQYDFVGEGGNLHFGDANYTGEFDLFGWSCTASNYGLLQSNHNEVYTGDFVDWGGLFTGGAIEWSSLSGAEMTYIINHHNWTTLVLDPTPEDADNEDEIYGVAIFPIGWTQPAGFEKLHYKLCDWNEEAKFEDNTFALSFWSTLEAAGAVFMPMAGARAGHWGNTWSGTAESSTKNPNPNGGNSYCFVDNVGWYGYYWSSTTDPRSNHPYDAQYLIFPGWSEGPTDADDDDLYLPPVVWSREKRRGNSVRLVHIIPRQYTVTYTAGGAEGTVPTDAATYLDGADVTLAAATGLSKDGYRFAGWKFRDQIYGVGETYTIDNVLADEEVVFEAQWEVDWQTIREGLTAGKYYTVCHNKKMTEIKGATLWQFAGRDASLAYIVQASTPYVAGRPYIVYATAEKFEAVVEGAEVSAPNNEETNGLYGTFEQLDQSNFDAIAAAKGNDVYFIYNTTGENSELRKVNGQTGNWIRANRAYVIVAEIPYSAPAPGRPVRSMALPNNIATGVDAINASETPVKMLIDGQLYILRGEKMYDATGRLVK